MSVRSLASSLHWQCWQGGEYLEKMWRRKADWRQRSGDQYSQQQLWKSSEHPTPAVYCAQRSQGQLRAGSRQLKPVRDKTEPLNQIVPMSPTKLESLIPGQNMGGSMDEYYQSCAWDAHSNNFSWFNVTYPVPTILILLKQTILHNLVTHSCTFLEPRFVTFSGEAFISNNYRQIRQIQPSASCEAVCNKVTNNMAFERKRYAQVLTGWAVQPKGSIYSEMRKVLIKENNIQRSNKNQ